MKKRFATVIALTFLVIGLGFYRGWFTLSSPSSDTGSDKVNINLTVDQGKVKEDATTVKNKTSELVGKVTQGANQNGDQAKDTK
jgi:hypothetical protein